MVTSCLEHGPSVWDQGWAPKWTNQPHEERKALLSLQRVPWPLLASGGFCPRKGLLHSFSYRGWIRTYVLNIYSTLFIKLVSLYLSNSLALCPADSCPFYKISACMTGCSDFKSWALTFIRNLQFAFQRTWLSAIAWHGSVKFCNVETFKWNSIKYALSVSFLNGLICVFHQSVLDIFITPVIYVHCKMIRKCR